MPMSASGLYVKSAKQLQLVVDVFGKTTTMWFGINPKKRMMNKYGKMRFAGTDVNITQIKFLFIDIDRVTKEGAASTKDLLSADFLAEKVLEESEKKFRDLVEITTDLVWEVDENGIYTYISPKIKDILGYEVDEVLGKTPFDLMLEEEAAKISPFFKEKVAFNYFYSQKII